MTTSCNDVCDIVIAQLLRLDFPIDDESDHDEILAALEQCRLYRIVTLDRWLELEVIWVDDGKYWALNAIDKLDGDQEELLMGWVGEEAELEEWLRDHTPPDTWTEESRWSEEYPEEYPEAAP